MTEPIKAAYNFLKNELTTPLGMAALFFFLAVVLRLSLVTTSYYGMVGEQYRDLEVIWRLFNFHDFPLLGPSSALGGFYFGAFYYYVEAIFVRLANFAPYGAVLTSSFFSLLSLPVLYALCKHWFSDPWVAAVAVAIQSIALFDIQNAYYISNPNLLPFFVLVFLYYLTLIIEGKKTLANFALLGLATGIAAQLHATGLVLLPLILIWIFFSQRIAFSFKHGAVFILFYIGMFAPYFIYVFKNNFSVFRALFTIGQHQASSGSRLAILGGFFNFFGSFFIFKDGFFNFYPGYAGWFVVAVGLMALIIILAIRAWSLTGFGFSREGISRAGYSLLAAWFTLGLTMYIIFAVPPAYYYFIVMWPLPVIVAAWWLCTLRKISVKYFWTLAGSYAALQLLCVIVFFTAIYQPQYSYTNLQRLFGGLKQAAANRSYEVTNQVLDINQFYYYLKMDNIPIRHQNGSAYVIIYAIIKCPVNPNQPPLPWVLDNYRGLCLTGRQRAAGEYTN